MPGGRFPTGFEARRAAKAGCKPRSGATATPQQSVAAWGTRSVQERRPACGPAPPDGWLGAPTTAESSATASYGYVTNSALVETLTVQQDAATRLTTTRAYDALNRLQSIGSVPAGSAAPRLPMSSACDHDMANQHTRLTLADGRFWVYAYDRLGQVVSGKRYWPDGTPVAGQQLEHGFDDIGNRTGTQAGGDASLNSHACLSS